MYDTIQFEKDLKALGVELSPEQIQQFLTYYEMLVEWNEVMNLTAITEYEEVMKKHFVDSLSLVQTFDVSKKVSVIEKGIVPLQLYKLCSAITAEFCTICWCSTFRTELRYFTISNRC